VVDALVDASAGLLRCEVTVRGKQLSMDGFQQVSSWLSPSVVNGYWSRYMSALVISSGVDLLDSEVLGLPRRLRGTYELWRRGGDCYELLSRATRFRHRKELLAWSRGRVDIDVMRPSQVAQPIATVDVADWLRGAPVWRASGVIADWLVECCCGAA
jgi:hypothetical protein